MNGTTCIVTIHGIGFQQPPENGSPGYADDLHHNLCAELNKNGMKRLSDDPSPQARPASPIYVQSVWPVRSLQLEKGIERLGSWTKDNCSISSDEAPLVKENFPIAHVALVYSQLEGDQPEVGSAVQALAMLIASGKRYSSFEDQLDILSQGFIKPHLEAIWKQMRGNGSRSIAPPKPSLSIRQDNGSPFPHVPSQHLTSPWKLLRELDNDVAVYVCQNELRQRVRGFIREVLLRLAARQDIANIVLNTHSNGTLIGLDALQELPPCAMEKIRAIITAGSPLRKYVDLFAWGKYITTRPQISCWWNFWDPADIVADPLRPDPDWHRPSTVQLKEIVKYLNGHQFPGNGIYQILQPDGTVAPSPILDIPVDNLAHLQLFEQGGLPAHNYWDNREEFIPKVATLVDAVTQGQDLSTGSLY